MLKFKEFNNKLCCQYLRHTGLFHYHWRGSIFEPNEGIFKQYAYCVWDRECALKTITKRQCFAFALYAFIVGYNAIFYFF